jgi:hypothetical protein
MKRPVTAHGHVMAGRAENTTQFLETATISEMDREKIFHVNAEHLLKLP